MKEAKHRNGVRHPSWMKERAVKLRQGGRTHREIARELGISLGSADLWAKNIVLSIDQKEAIQERRNRHHMTTREKKMIAKRLHPFQFKRQYNNDDLIHKIRQFHRDHGRIPLKRELNSLRIFRQRFGSWNNAITRAGFSPNPVLFAKKFLANAGHHCDSFTEKIVDDWLYSNNITHERNFRYGKTKMTADFIIQPNIVLEFFGLAGVQKTYDAIIETKRSICKELNLKLIEIYPTDIFPKSHLPELLSAVKRFQAISAN